MLWEMVAGWFSGLWAWFTDFERGTLGEWFSGAASAVAVAVALYFARDAQRVKLRGFCSIYTVISKRGIDGEIIWLSVTNCDSRPVTIKSIGVTVGRKKNSAVVTWFMKTLNTHLDPDSSTVPTTIGDGEEAKFTYPLERGVKQIIETMVQKKSDAKKLRFVVYATRGQGKSIKPEKSLVDAMINELSKQTNQVDPEK